jgi:hypothetical protein
MPMAPEALKSLGKVWLAKVHHKMKARQWSAAARDAAVCTEISVNLPNKG